MTEPTLDTSWHPRRREGVRVRRVSGRLILILPSGGAELNETAESVWTLSTGSASVDEIVAKVAEEYDVDVDQVRDDVVEVLEDLASRDALDVVAPA